MAPALALALALAMAMLPAAKRSSGRFACRACAAFTRRGDSRLGFDKPSGTHSSPHDGWVQTDIATRLPQISLMPDQALANE